LQYETKHDLNKIAPKNLKNLKLGLLSVLKPFSSPNAPMFPAIASFTWVLTFAVVVN